MKARPILMSAPMVRALLAGTKSQTRREIRPQPGPDGLCRWSDTIDRRQGPLSSNPWVDSEDTHWRCPYGEPGDLLWVRETWAWPGEEQVIYRADPAAEKLVADWRKDPNFPQVKWRPSIFMPRQHSRITLRITEVRVQRLQDISDEDCKAEGIIPHVRGGWHWHKHDPLNLDDWHQLGFRTLQFAYKDLFERINGKDSWLLNEWVWCVEFECIQANVDEVLGSAT